jgi:hypothetical protein
MPDDTDMLSFRVTTPNLNGAIEMRAPRGLEVHPEAYQVLVLEAEQPGAPGVPEGDPPLASDLRGAAA